MGLLDYYRQFDDLTEEEVNRGLRERRAAEKALALEHVPVCDLSRTEWPDFPDAEVMNASIFAARGGVNGYPDRHASQVRAMLADRHEIERERIVIGNGATELLQAAAFHLLDSGDELVTPWPSYPLYPLMAQRAGARPVAVDLAGGAVDPDAVLRAVGKQTRIVVLCNPNDPTGTYVESSTLERLLSELPERVHLLLDEAYAQFQDREPVDAALRLTDRFPHLLVFRTFSKAYGLSGLRAGYAVGSPEAANLLESIAPVLGINALTQAALVHTLKIGDPEIERRRRLVREQRIRVFRAFHDLPVDAPESQANFVWCVGGPPAAQVYQALKDEWKILVRLMRYPGLPDGLRITVGTDPEIDRLLVALRTSI